MKNLTLVYCRAFEPVIGPHFGVNLFGKSDESVCYQLPLNLTTK